MPRMIGLCLALVLSLAACGGPPTHSFRWSWALVDRSNPDPSQPLTCGEAGVASVGLAFKGSGGAITPFQWGCVPAGHVATTGLPIDHYSVVGAALDADMNALATTDVALVDNLRDGEDLGRTLFEFTPGAPPAARIDGRALPFPLYWGP